MEHPLCIARLDKLSRDEEIQAKLWSTDWDLVIVDEGLTEQEGTSDESSRGALGSRIMRSPRCPSALRTIPLVRGTSRWPAFSLAAS